MRTSMPTRRRSRTRISKRSPSRRDLLKQTPKDEYLLADIGGYYAALGNEKESLPLLAQAAALAPDIPEVLYQVAVGYEMLHHRDEALRWLAKGRASGYPAEAIVRNPLLAALRADPRYVSTAGAVVDPVRTQEKTR